MGYQGRESSRKRKEQMQRTWRSSVLSMLQKQQGGLCGWSGGNRYKTRSIKEQGLVDVVRSLDFTPENGKPPED